MTDRIITLTMNPTVDIASDADAIRPVHKVRTRNESFDPGGGGVNVSRVLRELGADTLAVVAAGGVSGRLLEELLDQGGVPRATVPTAGRNAPTAGDHQPRQPLRRHGRVLPPRVGGSVAGRARGQAGAVLADAPQRPRLGGVGDDAIGRVEQPAHQRGAERDASRHAETVVEPRSTRVRDQLTAGESRCSHDGRQP